MNIGKPKRVIYLEPLETPVPRSSPVSVSELEREAEPAELDGLTSAQR